MILFCRWGWATMQQPDDSEDKEELDDELEDEEFDEVHSIPLVHGVCY